MWIPMPGRARNRSASSASLFDWYGPVDPNLLQFLRHPVKAYKHWALRRRLGIYAPEEGDPEP